MSPTADEAGEDRRASVPYDRAQQQRRLQDAERKLAQLGRVNPLALEEFAALEQRHKFLTEQLADLTQTRKDLITIIEELDERMQVIFLAAFEDTRTAFGEVFPMLFPGGTGSISLTDPDEPLTTGIEVAVRPVGKKIERLSLLSGGERSLAAVALLVAIFKARPSPFYILDEVEAALDDANLGRLLGVLRAAAREQPAHRHHAPEAHDGDRRRAVRRLDAPGRRLGRRRPASGGARRELRFSAETDYFVRTRSSLVSRHEPRRETAGEHDRPRRDHRPAVRLRRRARVRGRTDQTSRCVEVADSEAVADTDRGRGARPVVRERGSHRRPGWRIGWNDPFVTDPDSRYSKPTTGRARGRTRTWHRRANTTSTRAGHRSGLDPG